MSSGAWAKRRRLILPAVSLLGIGLRLWGINFGLPYLYHPDEPVKVEVAQGILKTGSLDIHYFRKPPFYSYLNALAYFPYLAVRHLVGDAISIQSLEPPVMEALATGFTPQPSTFLLGRLLSALFGSLCIPMVYLLTQRLFADTAAALLAAGLVALSPGLIPHSRYMTPDSMVVFFCLLTVYTSIAVYRRGSSMDYALAGAAGALAASAKYDAVLVLVAPVAAHILSGGFRAGLRNTKIWICVASALVTFVVLNPVAVFSFREFYLGASQEAAHYAEGHLGMEGGAPLWYVGYFVSTEGLIALLGVIGLIAGCLKRSKESILLAAFPVVFFVFISSFAVRNDRTAIPITPFLYIFGALWLVELPRPDANGFSYARARTVLVPVVAGLMLLGAAIHSIVKTVPFVTVDGRETARVWIQDHFERGTKFGVEGYSPYIDPRRYHVFGLVSLIDERLAWYQAANIEYVVASQGMYKRFFEEPRLYHAEVRAYEHLFSSFELVKTFDDGGFEVRIYRVPPRRSENEADK